MTSTTIRFKKGDLVVRARLAKDSVEAPVIWIDYLRLTSMGKKQGTAVYLDDNENVRQQISPEHLVGTPGFKGGFHCTAIAHDAETAIAATRATMKRRIEAECERAPGGSFTVKYWIPRRDARTWETATVAVFTGMHNATRPDNLTPHDGEGR